VVLHDRTGILSAPRIKGKNGIDWACDLIEIESRRQRGSGVAALRRRGGDAARSMSVTPQNFKF
jgi:hypothetical protein